VSQQVGLQVGSLIETSLTDGTLVGRFLHVQDLVDRQCPGLTEPLSAVRTFERFFLGMNVPVVPQVVLPPEGLAADIAGVGPLVSVSSLVNQQVVGLGELSVTELANELFFGFGARGSGQWRLDDSLIDVGRNHCAVTRVLREEFTTCTLLTGLVGAQLKPVGDGGGSGRGGVVA